MLQWLVILSLLMLAGCSEPDPMESQSTTGVSFDREVLPILKRHCVICHMAGDTQGNFGLHPEPYLSLVSAPSGQSQLKVVEPGSLEDSYLYHKLMGTQASVGGEGTHMPYQRELLTKTDIDIISRWIIEGAKQDQDGK